MSDERVSFGAWVMAVGGFAVGCAIFLAFVGFYCLAMPDDQCTVGGIEFRQGLASAPCRVQAATSAVAVAFLACFDRPPALRTPDPMPRVWHGASARVPVRPWALPPDERVRRRARPRGKRKYVGARSVQRAYPACTLFPEGHVGLVEITQDVGGTLVRSTYGVSVVTERGKVLGYVMLSPAGKTYQITLDNGGECDCWDCQSRQHECKHLKALREAGEMEPVKPLDLESDHERGGSVGGDAGGGWAGGEESGSCGGGVAQPDPVGHRQPCGAVGA